MLGAVNPPPPPPPHPISFPSPRPSLPPTPHTHTFHHTTMSVFPVSDLVERKIAAGKTEGNSAAWKEGRNEDLCLKQTDLDLEKIC